MLTEQHLNFWQTARGEFFTILLSLKHHWMEVPQKCYPHPLNFWKVSLNWQFTVSKMKSFSSLLWMEARSPPWLMHKDRASYHIRSTSSFNIEKKYSYPLCGSHSWHDTSPDKRLFSISIVIAILYFFCCFFFRIYTCPILSFTDMLIPGIVRSFDPKKGITRWIHVRHWSGHR